MPTLHLSMTESNQSITLSGGALPRIEGVRLLKYSVSQSTTFDQLSLLVDIPWVTVGTHSANQPGAHTVLLPLPYGSHFVAQDLDIQLETSAQYMQNVFDVHLFSPPDTHGQLSAYVPNPSGGGANGATFEVNLWFDFTPVY